jgi:signal recognition particle receptor subunit beta
VRVHPLLAWTELDVWRYVQRENIPVCELYFSRGGKRFRSLGEKDITFPVASNASSIAEIIAELETTRQEERAGRAMDHEREDAFERLRAAGTCDDGSRTVAVCIAGHVDHGKSTLLGRLLHELDLLPDGKVESLKAASEKRGVPLEWSFVLDSFQLERDQAITLDTTRVRVRTPRRELLIIDAPGHRELLRNLVTGAADTSAALLVVDAQTGAEQQTLRHLAFLRLLGVRDVIVAVNKMDLADWREERFAAVRDAMAGAISRLGLSAHAIVPVSAREGANLRERAPRRGGAARRSSRRSRPCRCPRPRAAAAAPAGAGRLPDGRAPRRRRPHRLGRARAARRGADPAVEPQRARRRARRVADAPRTPRPATTRASCSRTRWSSSAATSCARRTRRRRSRRCSTPTCSGSATASSRPAGASRCASARARSARGCPPCTTCSTTTRSRARPRRRWARAASRA